MVLESFNRLRLKSLILTFFGLMEEEKSFLTKEQLQVLKLREKGMTQTEIAKKFGTSRSNIYSIEKRAKRNIERARKTLELSKKIRSPVVVKIGINEDIINGVGKFFSKADEAGIHVSADTPELISKIREEVGNRLEGRRAIEGIELCLTSDGKVFIS